MEFFRQEYWSELPCPPPGDLPNPVVEPTSLMSPTLASRCFTTSATLEAQNVTQFDFRQLKNNHGAPDGAIVKNLPANTADTSLIPGSRRSPGGGNGNPLQYSCLENPMERGTWQDTSSWGHQQSDMI